LHVSGASNFPLFRVGSPANSNILFVTGSGRVGIATTNPVEALHVVGSGRFEGSLDLGHGADGEYSLEIGAGRTGNGFAYIDLVGDTTYPDYGLRLIRGNGGANTTSTITTRGTGTFLLETNEAAPIVFNTTAAERARITSGGNFGIGTNNPVYKLQVTTTGAVEGIALDGSNNFVFAILESGTVRGYSPAFPTSPGAFSTDSNTRDFVYRVEAATQRFLFNTNAGTGGSTLAITGSRVGITKVDPTGSLHINSGTEQIALQIDSSVSSSILFVSSSGAVAVGVGAHPNFLNHKFMVFSGSISLRGPNDPAFSYRLNDTGSTNRNALYVSSSNYLALGNIGYTGLELFHTGSAPGSNAIDSGASRYYGTDQTYYLAEPNKWLAVRINNVNYVMPMYQV
jgi:hypothetical protein